MSRTYFQFKHFIINQAKSAMKVTTDACLFGAWVAQQEQDGGAPGYEVLDVGTGTGLLALIYAQKNPASIIEGVEIEQGAFEEARENFTASPYHNRLQAIHADIKTFLSKTKYEVIICNPPFYQNEILHDDIKQNIARHDAGLLIGELLQVFQDNLAASGRFYLLLPFKRSRQILKSIEENGLSATEILFVRQSVKHEYFRAMIKGTQNRSANSEARIRELSIWDDQQQYTQEFKTLLKDFYLHF